MASTQGIRAGRAFVELFADDSKLVRGLRRAERKIKAFGDKLRGFGAKMAGLGTALLAPLAASAKLFSGYGDQVAKMAKRTGLSVETLSELRFVASQTGTEFESLEMAFRKMQRSIYDAGRGLSTQVDAFEDLGLTFKDLDGLSPEDQFKLLADRISQVEDPTKRAAIAMTLFGRTGTNLLPMFASGAKGIEVLQKQARELGLTMSDEDAKAAEDFTDALDRLWKVVKMGIFHVGSALAPILQKTADLITTLGVRISTWIQQNRQVLVTVLKVIVGIIAAGAAIAALGTIISGFAGVLGVLVTVITTVVAVLKVLGAVLAFLVSPIGLVITAMAGLAGYLIYATDTGGKALDWLSGKFMALKEGAIASVRGISDALQAGDVALAARILWLSLKLAWIKGAEGLRQTWESFQAGLTGVFIDLTATLQKVWTEFLRLWRSATEVTANWLAKRLLEIQGLFDESLDVDLAKRYADQMTGAALTKINREAENRKQTIEDERQQRQKLNQDQYNANVAAQEAAVQAARDEWQAAIDQARRKREAKDEASSAPGGLDDPQAIVDKARDALAGLGDIGELVQAEAAKIGVRGTFNAAALRGLNSGGAADRTAKATEETAKHTKKLVQTAQTGGLTFA